MKFLMTSQFIMICKFIDCLLIDWLIYSFVVLTSNISTPCESIYWCLYRKTLRGKKPISFVPHRLHFEALSKLFDAYQLDVFLHSFYYILICFFNDRYLIRSENVRELMWIEIRFSISLFIEWAFLALLQC